MKFNKASLDITAVRESQYPSTGYNEFLLVGRSNVGKSSFINTILGRRNLARTSAKPGKTQTLNFYNVNDLFYLVDAPGYGYANVNKELKDNFGAIMEKYLETRKELKMVFMLVDFRHKPSSDDVMMFNYLRHYDIPMCIICTKCDKVGNNSVQKNKKIIRDTLGISDDDMILFSSVSKKGKDIVINKLEEVL